MGFRLKTSLVLETWGRTLIIYLNMQINRQISWMAQAKFTLCILFVISL